MLPLLLSALSCEQDSSTTVETQPAEKAQGINSAPAHLNLSLPDNLFVPTIRHVISEPDNNPPFNIKSILNRKTESIYSFSGDLYLIQGESDDLNIPLLEKIDGGRIDMQIKFEQP